MSDTESNVLYFGEPWGAPMLDGARCVPAPVGDPCLVCDEPITLGDQGLVRVYVKARGERVQAQKLAPVHAECEALGVVGHLFGVCSCTGFDTTSRDSARVLWQRLGDPAWRGKLDDLEAVLESTADIEETP